MLESGVKRSYPQIPGSGQPERITNQFTRRVARSGASHSGASHGGASHVVWFPVAGEASFEYAPELFDDIPTEPFQAEVRGVLYGLRRGSVVRVITARPDSQEMDSRLAGLEKIGVFAIRSRGRIFLTESDQHRLQALEAGMIALVVDRAQANLFLKEANGSHQPATVRSQVPDSAANPLPAAPSRNRLFSRSKRVGAWFALAAGLTAIPVLARPMWHRGRPPLALNVRETAGQLRIAWTPDALAGPATLEIYDGAEHRTLSIPPALSNVTYARRSNEVQIRFLTGDGTESARYVGTEPETAESRAAALRSSLSALEVQAKTLRWSIAKGQQRLAELQSVLVK
jgi:hypothetical protein